jgi:hypothetical protein
MEGVCLETLQTASQTVVCKVVCKVVAVGAEPVPAQVGECRGLYAELEQAVQEEIGPPPPVLSGRAASLPPVLIGHVSSLLPQVWGPRARTTR